jgi:hypothetical protein
MVVGVVVDRRSWERAGDVKLVVGFCGGLREVLVMVVLVGV